MSPFQIDFGALFTACKTALLGKPNWTDTIWVSARELWQSYMALALSVPAFYICAISISKQRAILFDTEASLIAPLSFAVVAIIYLLTFSASAYIICAAFNKHSVFRPWVILRHWSVFFIVLLAAMFYGLNLLGILPFKVANYAALGLYLSVLIIDIRLAQKIAGFELTPAIFTACIIFAMGLSVLLIGVVQIGGAA